MKRLALFLAILFTTIASFAQTPSTGQWDIVATSETNSNTVDGGPLQFSTDWTTTNGNSPTIAPVLSYTFNNSACSASGQPVNFTVSYNKSSKKTTIVATLDNNQTVTFTSTSGSASEFSGTFTSSGGGCTQADSGKFTATLYSALSGSFSGTIESYLNSNTINVTLSLSTSSSFNITGSIQSSDKACMADLTINGTAAQAYGPSFASGDTLSFVASDNSGDVVGFVASATDQNGNMLSPAWPSQVYVTYAVLAGPCAGDGGTDAPFQHVQTLTIPPHLPMRPMMHLMPRNAPARTAQPTVSSAVEFMSAVQSQASSDDDSSSDDMHKVASDSNSREQ
jgi:hypothetical protein